MFNLTHGQICHLGQIVYSKTTCHLTLELLIKMAMFIGQKWSFCQVVWFDKPWILVMVIASDNYFEMIINIVPLT